MIIFIAAASMVLGGQASDTTRSAREAFTNCLRSFVDRAAADGMEEAAFEAEYPRQCGTQQAAFREALIRRDTAARISRANAEESAGLEIEDARVNFSERYAMARPPRPAAAPADPAPASPAAGAAPAPAASAPPATVPPQPQPEPQP